MVDLSVFNTLGVDSYAVLDYRDLREINAPLRERMEFTPRAAIVYLVPYYTGETVNISRYAASLDYHLGMREISARVIAHLSASYPGAHFLGYGDHSPIDEVHAALISGLGIAGDNGLLISPTWGSYVFIGDILTDLDPALLGAIPPRAARGCSHCGACRRACPTGILRGEGSDCLSAITQRKGELAEEEAKLMRKYGTAWGCDVCQTVCPHNRAPKITPVEFFHRERITELTPEILKGMTRVEFSRRAFAWRGRKTVERNLAVLYGDDSKK